MFFKKKATSKNSAKYWSEHNVTSHRVFKSTNESLEYFHWRNSQYIDYIQLMPVSGHDNEIIVDFGCGPGHDLVGFCHYSKPQHLYGFDVSPISLDEARHRLSVHGYTCDLVRLKPEESLIPLDDASVDYVHCSGVLHHLTHPEKILAEFHRVLKPAGIVRLMVYNYDSTWLHLYVAHILMNTNQQYTELNLEDSFKRSTDGFDCPISRNWRVIEMLALAETCGFKPKHLGNAISLFEMSLLPQRFIPLMNPDFRKESREFLLQLVFDERAVPYFNGQVAGIDGCYELIKN